MSEVMLLRSSTGLYGADRMVLALNAALAKASVHSTLLSLGVGNGMHSPLHVAAIAQGQRAELLPCRGRVDPRAVHKLRNRMHGQPGILHAHDYKSVSFAWLATRGTSWKRVATTHGWVDTDMMLRLYNRLELTALRRFDAIVTVSSRQRERLLDAGVPDSRIYQIENGIPLPSPADAQQRSNARRVLGVGDSDTWIVASIGRLSPEKNVSCLLQACAILPPTANFRVLIAGDGPERAALEAQAAALAITERVDFLGELDDVTPLYHASDAVALPSLTEGMPLVVLEAMAAGKPVFATDVGDVSRLLCHAPYSRVMPRADPALLSQHLADALGSQIHDAAAREYVLRRHSAQAMASAYAALYQNLSEDRRHAALV